MTGERGRAPVDRALLDPDGIFPVRLAGDRAALIGDVGDLWTLEAEARELRLHKIATLAHRLAGAAGTFGYPAVSDAALALEEKILGRQPGKNPSAWRNAVQRDIDALLGTLDDSLADARR
jgi:HPt (histidine-containing phosphotransfer) domain-containing protein